MRTIHRSFRTLQETYANVVDGDRGNGVYAGVLAGEDPAEFRFGSGKLARRAEAQAFLNLSRRTIPLPSRTTTS